MLFLQLCDLRVVRSGGVKLRPNISFIALPCSTNLTSFATTAALSPPSYLCYTFMFLSVATSLARRDKDEVQHQISILLFIGLACGVMMMVFTRLFGSWALTGAKNAEIVPAANTNVQILGLAWPAVLIGWVAQSARIWYSWCRLGNYGVTSKLKSLKVVAAYMMMDALNKKGYSAFSLCVPSPSELLTIFGLAAPVFITMMSKVTT
ncbi:unnamed protein product [Microthlaspi erraticum]|uniref:Uncharacterized protein n=1 Tax=Microthlaspi erraticum TaxID=1685480 RepID=A0A6D2IRP6_9BRAS|nr:unnamed protein product [Microthlaspi erraticum]